MAAQLSIFSENIRSADGLYSLNDLHKASGGLNKHSPRYWTTNEQTKELIAEIEKDGIPSISQKPRLGTWVCRELVFSYAMWVSPKFHLHVIRAFDQMVNQPKPQQVIGSEGMRCLSALIKGKTSHLTGREQKSASTRLWNQLHTAFDVCSGMDIPEDQFNDARTFIASYAIEGEYLAREEQRGDEGYHYQEYGRYFADGRAILDELDKYVPGDAKTLLKQLDNVLLCSWTHMDESLSRLKVITAGLEKWRGPRSNLQHPFAQVR